MGSYIHLATSLDGDRGRLRIEMSGGINAGKTLKTLKAAEQARARGDRVMVFSLNEGEKPFDTANGKG